MAKIAQQGARTCFAPRVPGASGSLFFQTKCGEEEGGGEVTEEGRESERRGAEEEEGRTSFVSIATTLESQLLSPWKLGGHCSKAAVSQGKHNF